MVSFIYPGNETQFASALIMSSWAVLEASQRPTTNMNKQKMGSTKLHYAHFTIMKPHQLG